MEEPSPVDGLEPHLQFLLGRFTLLIRRLQQAEERATSSEEAARVLAAKLAAAEKRGPGSESAAVKRNRVLAHQLAEKKAQLTLKQRNHDDRLRALSSRVDTLTERERTATEQSTGLKRAIQTWKSRASKMKTRLQVADARTAEAVRREERALDETRRFLKQLRGALRRAAVLEGECKTSQLDLSQATDEVASLKRTIADLRRRIAAGGGGAIASGAAAARAAAPAALAQLADRSPNRGRRDRQASGRPVWQRSARLGSSAWSDTSASPPPQPPPQPSLRSPAQPSLQSRSSPSQRRAQRSPLRSASPSPARSPAFNGEILDAELDELLEAPLPISTLRPHALSPDGFDAHLDSLSHAEDDAQGAALDLRELIDGASSAAASTAAAAAGGRAAALNVRSPAPAVPAALALSRGGEGGWADATSSPARSVALKRVRVARAANAPTNALPSPLENEVAKQLKFFRAALERSLGGDGGGANGGAEAEHAVATSLWRSAAHGVAHVKPADSFRTAVRGAVSAAALSETVGSSFWGANNGSNGEEEEEEEDDRYAAEVAHVMGEAMVPPMLAQTTSVSTSSTGATAAELKSEIEREMSALSTQFGVVF